MSTYKQLLKHSAVSYEQAKAQLAISITNEKNEQDKWAKEKAYYEQTNEKINTQIWPTATQIESQATLSNQSPYVVSGIVNRLSNFSLDAQKRLSGVGVDLTKFQPAAPKPKRKTLLAPQRAVDAGKLTVILDLDETLIHSEFTGTNDYRQAELREHVSGRRAPDFSIVLYEGSTEQEEEIVHVYKRPGVEKFLEKLSQICEPVIFTAALPMYARPILKQIDPKRKCRSRLYRNATVKYRGIPHVKSLKNVGRDLSRVVIIDNSPVAMSADPDNGILCKAYYDDTEDRELDRLFEHIKQLVQQHDVRPYLAKHLSFHQTLHDTLAQMNLL